MRCSVIMSAGLFALVALALGAGLTTEAQAGSFVTDPEPLQGSCGDYQCSPPEDCHSCPSDCGDCCGDHRCAPPEDCRSCPSDCC